MDKFHLVLHDFGAPWGITMVAAHPERILSHTILNGPLVNLETWVIPLPMAPLDETFFLSLIASISQLGSHPLFLLVQYVWGVLFDPTEYGLKEAEAYLQQLRHSDYHARAFLAIMKGIEQTSENEDFYINTINTALPANIPKQIIWSDVDPGFSVEGYAIPLQKNDGY